MVLTYKDLNKIEFPVYKIGSGDWTRADGLLFIDDQLVDDTNQDGETLGVRRDYIFLPLAFNSNTSLRLRVHAKLLICTPKPNGAKHFPTGDILGKPEGHRASGHNLGNSYLESQIESK